MIETYVKFVQAHEKMVIVGILGLTLWLGIGRVDKIIAQHDQAALTQAQAVAKAQADKDAANAAAAQTALADYQALAEKVNAQNAALTQANVTLAAALTAQQKTDATLPPTDLVQRLNTLVPTAGASVANGQTTISESGTVAVVQTLEQVPTLTSQLADETKIANNDASLLASSQTEVSTLNTQITGLQAKAVDDAKVCQAQIAVVKAEARRSKRRWFLIGYIAGFLTRSALIK